METTPPIFISMTTLARVLTEAMMQPFLTTQHLQQQFTQN
jgi:hypothetical protein